MMKELQKQRVGIYIYIKDNSFNFLSSFEAREIKNISEILENSYLNQADIAPGYEPPTVIHLLCGIPY